MDDRQRFEEQKKKSIEELGKADTIKKLANDFIEESAKYNYSYNFSWMGLPIIQYPQDVVAMQEIIWSIKPDLVIETGIARGGSLIFYASILELIGKGEVIGIDIDIREHNKQAIEAHPLSKRISLIEGSSTSDEVLNKLKELTRDKGVVMVCLDSNHTHEHVLRELELYSPFVTLGSYLVVFDTIIEDMPDHLWENRPWDKKNNPKTAVWEFLKTNENFAIDKNVQNRLLITTAPDGYLKKVQ